jgi:hypothetical protein
MSALLFRRLNIRYMSAERLKSGLDLADRFDGYRLPRLAPSGSNDAMLSANPSVTSVMRP